MHWRFAALSIVVVPGLAACGSSTTTTAPPSPTSTITSSSPTPKPPIDPRDPAHWQAGPGFIGPLHVSATAQSLRAAGYVQALPQMACGVRWEPTTKLTDASLNLEFRGGDPNALDAVIAGSSTGTSRYAYTTAEGVGIGTTTAKLKEVYGDLQYGKWANNAGSYVGWVRTTSSGSILFNIGSTNPDDHAVGDGSHVTMMLVTAAPFKSPVDGC